MVTPGVSHHVAQRGKIINGKYRHLFQLIRNSSILSNVSLRCGNALVVSDSIRASEVAKPTRLGSGAGLVTGMNGAKPDGLASIQ